MLCDHAQRRYLRGMLCYFMIIKQTETQYINVRYWNEGKPESDRHRRMHVLRVKEADRGPLREGHIDCPGVEVLSTLMLNI